mmetsp:Transcript_25226/g.56393  ORF Transcript_25226/g.56393 Transcript_25226/m.56393 type:complete len:289 (+) Transcript_25226:511-1377(+)
MSLGCTFFRGSNVYFIILESADLALAEGKEPGGRADAGGFKEESGLEENINNRVAQESNGEAGSNQLPGDGPKDGGGDGSHESQVEQVFLDAVRDIEDVVFFPDINVDGGDTGNDEEAKGDSHLTTAHESRKILSTIAEQAVAGLQGHVGASTFRLGELGNSEESNLHTLKKTNATHEHNEEDEGDGLVESLPGRGLSAVKGFNGHSKSKREDTNREKNSSPEEGEGSSSFWRLIGFHRLSSGPISHNADQVRCVHDTSDLNCSSNPVGENHEIVVDVIKHHVRGIDL